jgi:glycosyltransferase involved in cell wall biosynthesis
MHDIAVIIPVLDAGRSIAHIISGVRRAVPQCGLVVVDDGSTDTTRSVVLACGATCLTHEANRGKGAALKTGFAWCLERGFKAMVTMDGDGQHDPREIISLIKTQHECGHDLVIGARLRNRRAMPLPRVITNRLSSTGISWITGLSIPDSQSGFRLISARVLQALELAGQRYDLESELLIKAAACGFSIGWTPIAVRYGNEVSHFRPFQDTWLVLKGILASAQWRRAYVC